MTESTLDDSFDFEWLPTCQYPVANSRSASGESDCGELAVAYGWWGDDYEGGWQLCHDHLDFICKTEETRYTWVHLEWEVDDD